ncbi:MAG: Cytochrome d ubiquinol oxidase subunit I (EC [uncultured Sulfurovum sp.]|uniref:Cytochrome d ubiquinol oxidase subunit I (EC) n=1 Tax=uncultured Sulfurovum sp. TaxID=269237 RepID=A0A6S6T4B8_9BACT|nr:MAG: Cytochrome d ubiquinol oxidase subunit I (EC [uncultured Sulfurovum sp.]
MEDTLLTDWSRAQFALTALYHWLFVPLTLGLSFIIAIMETIYVKTGNLIWKEITKFWMTLFAINFAIGLATGIIMEFEFGTNWSNYSWIVGDIFGAPLAIEGIMAFFMESTFFAIMFFGWDKVSKKMHLLSTWLVAIGSNLSALWILVANGWMQHPIGMEFNLDSARFEMVSFFDVLFNPNAYSKFLHTVGSGYVMGSLFVVGISAWYLLKNKDVIKAKKSMVVGATFGLITSIFLIFTGDESAHQVALNQPTKLAAMEGLYDGHERAGIVAIGQLNHHKEIGDDQEEFIWSIEIPHALSILGFHDMNAFVPGINDLVYGDTDHHNIESASQKMEKGKIAIAALKAYKKAKKEGDMLGAEKALLDFRTNEKYFGYGYLKDPKDIIPPVALTFYSFHIMVGLGTWFLILFFFILYFTMIGKLEKKKMLLRAAVLSIPLGYLAGELGWIVAEVGRQPWTIFEMLPVGMATSQISTTAVQTTFWLFAIVFTGLLIAEIRIMTTQIKNGMEGH